jgi:RecB family exonuclease
MSAQGLHVAASNLPRLSPSRLEAWDRCPAAYRFEYVLQLPQPIGDQRPRLLGSVAHALLEGYLQENLRTAERPELARIAAIADLIREAVALVTRWLAHWTVPVESIVHVERALAVDVRGQPVEWQAREAFIRGRLDLVTVAGPHATVLDWKSGWLRRTKTGSAPRGRRASTRRSSGLGRRGSRTSRSSTTTSAPGESPAWR